MDPVPTYYPNPNAGVGMPLVMRPMVDGHGGSRWPNGHGGTSRPDENGGTIGQMGIGAIGQMDIGAAGAGGFDVAAPESRPSSMVLQKDEQANVAEISSIMFVTGPGSATTTIEMDGIWKYKY
ncbi:unnamed protein product [Miscanthus lutarioriparius]|uniref:Uncharacterized protein n=1 Tax=Miscanthus lutarioriparius TaxID=422564 RepID=A0A811RYN3_9POAL|nr:unnamed protein product [Miscanthus lutarioriparius]